MEGYEEQTSGGRQVELQEKLKVMQLGWASKTVHQHALLIAILHFLSELQYHKSKQLKRKNLLHRYVNLKEAQIGQWTVQPLSGSYQIQTRRFCIEPVEY
jgi:hypothetical protein